MAPRLVTSAREWFAVVSAGAPEALRARTSWYLERQGASADVPGILAGAAADALSATLAHEGDRTIALDLLAADALVTLALQAHAERDPAGLATFAAGLREMGARPGVPDR